MKWQDKDIRQTDRQTDIIISQLNIPGVSYLYCQANRTETFVTVLVCVDNCIFMLGIIKVLCLSVAVLNSVHSHCTVMSCTATCEPSVGVDHQEPLSPC